MVTQMWLIIHNLSKTGLHFCGCLVSYRRKFVFYQMLIQEGITRPCHVEDTGSRPVTEFKQH